MEDSNVQRVTLTDLGQSIASITDRLDGLQADLDRMPSFKRNSDWHLDRVAEKRRLLTQRDRLRAEFVAQQAQQS
jgi:hypothetical protein